VANVLYGALGPLGRGAGRAAVWSPLDVAATAALWLDASDAATFTQSGGVVSEWRDKSGNARHGVQSDNARRPRIDTGTINGLPVVRKTGASQDLAVSMGSALVNPFTVFWVARFTSNHNYTKSLSATNAAQNYNGGAPIYRKDDNTWASYPIWAASAFLDGFGTALQNVSYQFGFSRPVPGNNAFVYVSGTSFNLGVMSGHNLDNTHLHPLAGDGFSVSVNQSGNNDCAEVVMYEGVLGTADRHLVEGYLAHKWGLTADLPAAHPYKVNPP